VSPRTVNKYLPRRPRGRPRGDLRWSTFLRLHAQGMIACDFFVAVTATFRLLYVLVVIEHRSRRLVHYNVTAHLSAACRARRSDPRRTPSRVHMGHRVTPYSGSDSNFCGSPAAISDRLSHPVAREKSGSRPCQSPLPSDPAPRADRSYRVHNPHRVRRPCIRETRTAAVRADRAT
jgi:hypothetical protein